MRSDYVTLDAKNCGILSVHVLQTYASSNGCIQNHHSNPLFPSHLTSLPNVVAPWHQDETMGHSELSSLLHTQPHKTSHKD